MSTRGNIYMTNSIYGEDDTSRGIYLYQHYDGYNLPEKLRKALEASPDRWDDAQYLQRIIFSRVLADYHGENTGAGLSLDLGDNGGPITVVDVNKNVVAFAAEGSETDRDSWVEVKSFREYVAQGPASWPDI